MECFSMAISRLQIHNFSRNTSINFKYIVNADSLYSYYVLLLYLCVFSFKCAKFRPVFFFSENWQLHVILSPKLQSHGYMNISTTVDCNTLPREIQPMFYIPVHENIFMAKLEFCVRTYPRQGDLPAFIFEYAG